MFEIILYTFLYFIFTCFLVFLYYIDTFDAEVFLCYRWLVGSEELSVWLSAILWPLTLAVSLSLYGFVCLCAVTKEIDKAIVRLAEKYKSRKEKL